MWETAPYLHDGSAPALLDVLTSANPLGLHGETAPLSFREKEELIAYLMQIDDLEPPALETAPAIVVIQPEDRASIPRGDDITILTNTGGALAAISRVEFYADGALLGTDSVSPYRFVWRGAQPGEHSIAAMLVFRNGVRTTSNPARITVVSNDCRIGNVNAAVGPVADVLFVNGSAGVGGERRVVVERSAPFQIRMDAPPSQSSGPSHFVLYLWTGEAGPSARRTLPWGLGVTCMPTPLNGGSPLFIANNLGRVCQLGLENWPQRPTRPAPSAVLDLPNGLRRAGTWFLQGLIVDSASPQGQAAVTNGIELVSR